MSNFEHYKSVIEGLGFGSAIGEKIPDSITYGEAVKELRYYIAMANEEGEPLNLDVFGDEYDEPTPSVRKAYLKAKRLVKKFRVMDKTLRMN